MAKKKKTHDRAAPVNTDYLAQKVAKILLRKKGKSTKEIAAALAVTDLQAKRGIERAIYNGAAKHLNGVERGPFVKYVRA